MGKASNGESGFTSYERRKRYRHRDNKNNQRDFMDQLGNRLGYKEINAWYGVTKKVFTKWDFLLNEYGGSPSKLVTTVYDTHQWRQSRFNTHMPNGYWENKDNQRDFMDQLGRRLGCKEINAWYGVTQKQIYENGGVSLLNKYGWSRSKLVMAVYDTLQWQQSHFNTQQGYWNNKNNQRDFMDQLGNRLEYKEINAWHTVTAKQIHENGGVTLLNKYGNSPSKLVMAVYDTHQWQQSRFNTPWILGKQRQSKRLYGSIRK